MNWGYQGNCKLLYFFYKKISHTQKEQKRKQVIFFPLDVFYGHKNAAFLFLIWLFAVFFARKSSCKKQIKKFKIALIPSIHHTTDVYLSLNPPIKLLFIYTHLFLFVTICNNLFLFMRIFLNLFLFMRIFLKLFLSFWIFFL